MIHWPAILDQIQQNTGLALDSRYIKDVSGGSISSCFILGKEEQNIFLKTNRRAYLTMFEAEAAGLNAIARTRTILTPQVLCTGFHHDTAYIALQTMNLHAAETGASYAKFGRLLAAMHQSHQPRFGAGIDNTIGTTPQCNTRSDNWYEFWRKHRLGYQLKLAQNNNAPTSLIDDGWRLNETFENLFDTPPEACCLHGDLWRGNWGFTEKGGVVIFDPAHYFGDREADIAMTRLFGAAHPDFYAAYNEFSPLAKGHEVRETFYNLYHILNHYNLFGGSYAHQAQLMIQNVLSELA